MDLSSIDTLITWKILMITSGTLLLLLVTNRLYATTSKEKTKNTHQQTPSSAFHDKIQVKELYERIHNVTDEKVVLASNFQHEPAVMMARPRRNIETDSCYHHAIKLLQSGMDAQKLVEYCNLTLGEAELLATMYSKRTIT